MEKTQVVYSSSPLFPIFLVLKLCGVINWSWWWVTCPLWIAPAVLLTIALVAFLLALPAIIWKSF